MSEQITITLPDGSTREYAPGDDRRASRGVDRPRLAKAAVAAQGRRRVRSTSTARSTTTPRVAIVTADSDDGREVLRHSTAHVMAQAVIDLFPGAKYAIGPAIADGFYYDFELPGRRSTSPTTTSSASRRGCARSSRPTQPFVREELDYDDALDAVRRPAVQARDHRTVAPATRRRRRGRGRRRRRHLACTATRADGDASSSTCAAARTCRRPARLGAFKLTKVAGAYWRGDEKRPMLQRIYGTAWESKAALDEHLHRLEEAEQARPPQARRRARPVLVPRGDRLGPRGVPSEGRHRPPAHGGLLARSATRTAGYEFVNSPHITKASLFETSGHLDWFADGMFPPMELDGGTDYYLKPMNCPFHILIYQQPHALVPRAAAAAVRVRHGVPLREVGRRARPHARPRHDPGRRAHLLHQGADGRRARVAARLRARPAARLRPRRLLPRAVDQARGQGGRHRRGVGRGHRGAARRPREADGPRARDGRGRRRVLRPEDLGAGARRDRPHVADVDDPARLPAARSASTSTTSAPTTSATGRS